MKTDKLIACFVLWACGALAQTIPADYDGVLKTLGKQGDFKDGVLKVNIPRNDLKIAIDGIATPTPFGFGGWLVFTKGDGGMEVMMGDIMDMHIRQDCRLTRGPFQTGRTISVLREHNPGCGGWTGSGSTHGRA